MFNEFSTLCNTARLHVNDIKKNRNLQLEFYVFQLLDDKFSICTIKG